MAQFRKKLNQIASNQMHQNTRTLKLTTLGVIGFHFVIVVLHSVAHEVLSVKATPAQLAFIFPVIIIAPVLAGLLLSKFNTTATALLTASMFGSFVFGVYYHFIADTIDHVSHVARLQPVFWSQMFQVTSYLLAISEIAGAVLGATLFLRLVTERHAVTR